MTLHLRRLAVGVDSIEHLQAIQRDRLATARAAGGDALFTFTRMTPRRAQALCDGGSLYWVIKGQYRVRQAILGIETDRDEEGRRYCRIRLDPNLVPVRPRVQKAFQGWRYLAPADAPPDDNSHGGAEHLPDDMAAELKSLGLL